MMRFHVNGKPVKGLLSGMLGVGFFILLVPTMLVVFAMMAAMLTIGALIFGTLAIVALPVLAVWQRINGGAK